MLITKDMLISETMKRFPKTVQVFRRLRMECPACMGAESETIESGALMHGLDPDEVVGRLNAAAAGKGS